MTKYFVWVQGLRGPEPQIWNDKQIDAAGKVKLTLFITELSKDIENSNLSTLTRIYANERPEQIC